MNVGIVHVPVTAFERVLSEATGAFFATLSMLNKDWRWACQAYTYKHKVAKLHEYFPDLLDAKGNLLLVGIHIRDTDINPEGLLQLFVALAAYPRRPIDLDALFEVNVFNENSRRSDTFDNTLMFFMHASMQPFVAHIPMVRYVMQYLRYTHLSTIDPRAYSKLLIRNGWLPERMLINFQALKYNVHEEQHVLPPCFAHRFDNLVDKVSRVFESCFVVV